jgi:hypothetical protein
LSTLLTIIEIRVKVCLKLQYNTGGCEFIENGCCCRTV